MSKLIRVAVGFAMASLVCAAAVPARADEPSPPVTTDSPNFVPSTRAVETGDLQIETGVQQLRDGSGPTLLRAWTTPTTLRFGLEHQTEFRVTTDAASHVRTLGTVDKGFSDIALGIKGVVPGSFDPRFSAAWVVDAALPTGSQALRTPGVRPSVALTLGWQLPHATSLRGVGGVRMDEDLDHQRFANGLLGVNVTRAWNARFQTFGELDARAIRSNSRGGKLMMWNVGAGWAPLAGTQLDAAMGFGLKDNDPDFAWTLGITRRFTPHVPGALSHNQQKKKDDATPSASTESTDGK